jgi:hypothetical protein
MASASAADRALIGLERLAGWCLDANPTGRHAGALAEVNAGAATLRFRLGLSGAHWWANCALELDGAGAGADMGAGAGEARDLPKEAWPLVRPVLGPLIELVRTVSDSRPASKRLFADLTPDHARLCFEVEMCGRLALVSGYAMTDRAPGGRVQLMTAGCMRLAGGAGRVLH